MRFQFQQEKSIQVMAYIVKRLGAVEKVKLMKLIYLSDKAHFLNAGHPITGDKQAALPWGPIPSETLNVLNGTSWPNFDAPYRFLHLDDNFVMLRVDPGTNLLEPQEAATIDAVLQQYGRMRAFGPGSIVEFTHRLPEYVEAFTAASDRGLKAGTITYDSILRHAGDESHFRLNRPVVSMATLVKITCPLNAGEDADL